jgi:hypothetical protein
MVQGASSKNKLGKKKVSAGAVKKKAVTKSKIVAKGRRQYGVKGGSPSAAVGAAGGSSKSSSTHEFLKEQRDITKTINKKNEALIAAKAVSAGAKFSILSEVATKGAKELKSQIKARNKKQEKSGSRATQRLQEQLRKLETGGAANKRK